jgi:hypothetical protein
MYSWCAVAVAGACLVVAAPAQARSSYYPSSDRERVMTAAGAPEPALTASAARRGAVYAGATSEQDPIVVQLARSRASVTRIVVQAQVPCASGMAYLSAGELKGRLPIARSGAFKGASTGTEPVGANFVATRSEALEGVVGRTRVSGRWALHADIVDMQTQATVDTCDIAFTFKGTSARSRVFGGATSQHTPIVLGVSRSGSQVSTVGVGWRGACTPQGAVQFGESFINFPLRAGRFGDDFAAGQQAPDGSTTAVQFSLHGRLGRASGSGTFQALLTDRDPAGNTRTECPSGPVSWKVASG